MKNQASHGKPRTVHTRHKRKPAHKKRRGGFTIIEVLIVLSIAGLILAAILLAVGALNRSARNHQRKVAVDYAASALEEYYSNNGHYPLYGPGAAQDGRISFVDALTSGSLASQYDIRYIDKNGSHEYPFGGSGAPANPDDTLDEISIEPGHVCNTGVGLSPGDTDYPLKGSASGDSNYRAYAVWTLLEQAPIYCVDNSLE